jgi:hypothetical protein
VNASYKILEGVPIVGGVHRTPNHQLAITNYQLPITNHQPFSPCEYLGIVSAFG